MRKVLLLIIVLFSVLTIGTKQLSAVSNGIDESFKNANQLYEEGKFDEALNLYRTIEGQIAHWKLFYNMGNCYYKTGDFVKAKIYYLRAERLKPFDSSIQKNIDIVNKRFSDKIEPENPDFISRTVQRIETLISLNMVSAVLIISIIVLNLFIFLLIKNGRTKFRLYGVSFSLVIVLLIAGYHIYRTGKQSMRNTAVVIKIDTELRSGPGENNTILFKVNPGLKVKIIEKSRNWVQVSASSQIAGWIEASRIEPI
jgi:tetratricopeptide (TPR) repeat protein